MSYSKILINITDRSLIFGLNKRRALINYCSIIFGTRTKLQSDSKLLSWQLYK